jgi:hypothetical protein
MTIRKEISENKFLALLENNLSLDHIYLLLMVSEGIDITKLKGKKVEGLVQTLERKWFVKDGKLSEEAKKIVNFEFEAKEIVLEPFIESKFVEWWSLFPGTDTFEYKNVRFVGTRGIRINKEDCKKKFNLMIAKKEYTPEQIIEATKLDILRRKEASINERKNKLTFLQNSSTYLNQKSFDPYIEEIGKQETKQITSTVDV